MWVIVWCNDNTNYTATMYIDNTGMKGSSISHYLKEMTNFIFYNQDLKNPQATVAMLINYKQGFNRC